MAIHMLRMALTKKIIRQLSQSRSSDVPKGYLAAYVGEQEKKRFVVPVSILNQPSFQDLLRRAEEEVGFQHQMGGLTIPCKEDIFVDLTSRFRVL